MTTKYGDGQVYEFVTAPEDINGPPPVLRDRGIDRQHLRLQDLGAATRRELHADRGWQDGRPGLVRPLLPADQRRDACGGSVPTCRFVQRTTQIFQVGPWSSVDTNGDGEIDTLETRTAARRIHGLTPISVETDTNDPSWTLNVADGLKNQYTDQFTLNFEREVARNLSFSASYIYKRAGNLFANLPINEVTGQPWDYERIPFTTSSGQQVMLYSVVFRDYNGDGVLDGEDVGVDRGQQHLARPEHAGVRWRQAQAHSIQGLQFVLNKRYSERWQGLASVLISNSDGISRRSFRQDFNVEAPMFYDDNWMGNINYTVNNLDGPLPFTPEVRAEAVGLVQGSRGWKWISASATGCTAAARYGCSRTTRCTRSSRRRREASSIPAG